MVFHRLMAVDPQKAPEVPWLSTMERRRESIWKKGLSTMVFT